MENASFVTENSKLISIARQLEITAVVAQDEQFLASSYHACIQFSVLNAQKGKSILERSITKGSVKKRTVSEKIWHVHYVKPRSKRSSIIYP